ncbi:MAG: autotransporter-associated beta strand repeat-containing protein [Tepidisphaeraceae bacterium]
MSLSSRGGLGRIVAGISGLVLVPTSIVSANPSDTSYRLVFADEFNGTTLDTSKWSAASPGWTMPNSLSTASADQVSVANGVMTMNAVRTGTNTWSSGSISTYNKYNFAGGYVEARIQLPTTPGSWPAFWGLYTGWPPEMDIMEYPLTTDGGVSGYANNRYSTNFHYTNSSGAAAAGAGVVTTGSNLAGTWHTFAADWTSGTSVRFLLDGVQVQSFSSSSVAQMANMYMILDYAVGGWPGTPSTSQWAIGASDQTNVDWVRVWQRNANADASSTWNVNGGGAFSTAANWTGGGVPMYGNQTAIFGRVGTAATASITFDSWDVFGGITFDGNATGTTAYTLGTSASLIQLATTASAGVSVQATANSTVSQNINNRVELWSNTTFKNDMTGGQTLNLNSEVSGAGMLNVSGVGTTNLNATNSYTGGTVIGTNQEAAVLRANADGALGTGGVVIGTAGNATTARMEVAGGRTIANAIDLRGRTNSSVAIESVSGNNTLSGTITANSGGNIYQIQSDADTLTLSGAAGSGVALQAGSGSRVFTLQGAGNGVVSGKVQNGSGTVGITKAGTGTWTLTGANTYTGATAVTGGKLILANTGAMAGTSVSAGATLAARGNLANNAAVSVAGTLDLADGTINAVATSSTLSLNNSTLNLELGNGTAADRIAATGTATVAGTNTVNVSTASGQSVTNGSAYTIVSAASGLNAANFTLGTKPASLGFYNFTLTTPTASSLILTATGAATPTTAYWTGAGSTATADGSNNWAAGSTVSTSNWSTNAAGTVDALQVPGSVTNVIFTAASAPASGSSFATQLDSDYAIKGLTFDVPVGSGLATVTLGTNGNSLTIGSGGLTLAASSAANATVSGAGGIKIDGSQTWSNQSNTQLLKIGTGVTPLAGNATLTVQGTGTAGVQFTGVLADSATGLLSTVFNQAATVTLTAQNTYTGTTTVNGAAVDISPTGKIAGDIVINSGGTLRDTHATDGIGDSATLTVNSGGTFDLRGTNGVGGSETISRLAGSGTVTRTTSGTAALTVGSGNASSTFSGIIQNGSGLFSLTKIGAGTLTLSGASTYTGGTTIADTGGSLLVTSNTALGAGNVTIGQGGSEPTGKLQLSGNISLTGVPTINLSSRSLTTLGGSATIENVSGNNTIAANLNINNTGGSVANILSTAGTLTLTGSLSSTGLTSARGFDFYGSGDGVVSGVISNGTAQATFIQKDGSGAWTLSGNNTFTGGTTVNAGTLNLTGSNNFGGGSLTVNGGTAVLSGSNTYTGGTTITNGTVVMANAFALGTTASTVNLGTGGTLVVDTAGSDRAYNLNVGSNSGAITLTSGNSASTTGINHTLGTLSIGINDTVNVTAKSGITGSPSVTLGNVTLSSGVGAGSSTFNPTTASLKVGAITTSTNSAKTVILDGTAAGNAVNGAITNGSNVLTLVKSNTSAWTLAAASTFSGGTTINDGGGSLILSNGGALGTGAVTIGNGGSNKTGVLQLSNNITVSSVSAINIAGRNLVTAGGAAAIENIGGTNTIAAPINFANFGGNAVNVTSSAGQITLAGNLSATTVTGSRIFGFDGGSNGVVSGAISNGTATVGVQKSGTGRWTLSGANSYTGTTTIAAGELRATSAAYANLLTNAGGTDLTGNAAKLTLDYTGTTSPASQVKALLQTAYAAGFASGQIRSTTATASRGLGWGDNGSAVTVLATLYGDADLDGDVDFNDFLALQANFGNASTRFDQGDFNYDGTTDFNDFLALQANFGQSVFADTAVTVTSAQVAAMTAFGLTAAVPEPATIGLIGFGAFGLLGRKRRRA